MNFNGMTAADCRKHAEDCRRREAESWERSDTDGCVSQWCSSLSAQQYDLQASIIEAGGKMEFLGLFDRATRKRVRAKLVSVKDRYSYGYVSKWIVLDSNNKAIHWVPAFKKTKRAKLYELGFEEDYELAPCVAAIGGHGTGLSGLGSAYVYARRTDEGYPPDAVPVDKLEEVTGRVGS